MGLEVLRSVRPAFARENHAHRIAQPVAIVSGEQPGFLAGGEGGHREWLWAFLDHDGVDPTNNASERSLRHAVIWRKLSFGTQSERGSRFVETMLSVIETCRQQKRNVFAFVTAAVEAHFARRPAPLLLAGV